MHTEMTLNDQMNLACIKMKCKMLALKDDISGSESTEKIGMVVVAVLVVAALAAAMQKLMPELFETIGTTTKTKLTEILDKATAATGPVAPTP